MVTDVFFKRIRPEKEKARAAGASDNRRTERTSQKCFRCGSEDDLIKIFKIHQKIIRSGESKYVLMKKVIVNSTTA